MSDTHKQIAESIVYDYVREDYIFDGEDEVPTTSVDEKGLVQAIAAALAQAEMTGRAAALQEAKAIATQHQRFNTKPESEAWSIAGAIAADIDISLNPD
jgi:hypothetical protein